MEAELEDKRREQERKHEENMMTMMMGFMNQMMGSPALILPPYQQTHFPNLSQFHHISLLFQTLIPILLLPSHLPSNSLQKQTILIFIMMQIMMTTLLR